MHFVVNCDSFGSITPHINPITPLTVTVSIFVKYLMRCCDPPVIVVLTNREDSMTLLLEAERQGLMNGDYVFFLVQHFEVSGSVVSKTLKRINSYTHIQLVLQWGNGEKCRSF